MVSEFKKLKISLVHFVLIIPVILFGIFVFRHAIDMPYMDDMELVKTINDVREDPTELFSVLMRQQNDHRITFARLGMLAIYLTTGNIDFRLAILLGYLNLVLLCFGFFLALRSQSRSDLYFLPVVLLLFSPFIYQVHLWSITSFQYTLSIAFSIISLFFLQPEKTGRWILAIPFCIAATLTNLDGLSVIPLAIFWLICQRRWKEVAVFFCFSAIYLIFYFSRFEFSSASRVTLSPSALPDIGLAFLAITGSAAKIISDTYAVKFSIIFGVIVLLIYAVTKFFSMPANTGGSFIKRFFVFDLTEMCFIRLLASMFMITIGRSGTSIDNMMATRFSVYAISVVIVLYLLVLKTIKNKSRVSFQTFSIVSAVLVCAFSYYKYSPDARYLTSKLKADSYNYAHNNVYFYQYLNLPDPEPDFYRNYQFSVFLQQAADTKSAGENVISDKNATASLTTTHVSNTGQYGNYLKPVIEFNVEIGHLRLPENEVYLSICSVDSSARRYFVALREKNDSWVRQIFKEPASRQFFGAIPRKVPAGTYIAKFCWFEKQKPVTMLVSDNVFID